MNFSQIEYQGWNDCVCLSNGKIDLVVTTQVGPRIIRFGFVDGPNMFKEYSEMLGRTGDEVWNIYGGHRLWHAPENDPRTYWPDNSPVESAQSIDSGVHIVQRVEGSTSIQKELEIRVHESEARVEVLHRLRNTGMWPVELAPWALSVMATGGTAIIPLPPRGTHPEDLLPTSSITLWSFTHMNDPRWTWGEKYILLRQDENATTPQKIGVHVRDGWSAYANKGNLFVKTFDYSEGASYPDSGSVVETFTNNEMLELETLGPAVELEPGATIKHMETWSLHGGDMPIPKNDADVDAHVLPLIEK